jgi:hypothetical protein
MECWTTYRNSIGEESAKCTARGSVLPDIWKVLFSEDLLPHIPEIFFSEADTEVEIEINGVDGKILEFWDPKFVG